MTRNTVRPIFTPLFVMAVLALFLSLGFATVQGQSPIYVDKDATGANSGANWTDAFTSLQDALATATSGDEIWVADGVYYPDKGSGQISDAMTSTFSIPPGVAVYGGFVGTETNLTKRDWAANVTVLSGDIDGNDTTDASGVVTTTANIVDSNAYHVVTLDGTGTSITNTTRLDGFTITAGQAKSYLHERGGGLYCEGKGLGNECSPTVANVTFSANSANAGGGMYNYGFAEGTSSPVLNNVTFSNNSAGGGGAVANIGSFYGTSSPVLIDVTFVSNTASGAGGAMSNGSDSGGTSSPVLTNVIFDGNSATGGDGGAIYSYHSSPTLMNVTFNGNTTVSNGGAIYHGYGDLVLTGVTFNNNTAGSSGGAMLTESSSLTLTNAIFVGNSAGLWGGAMHNTTSNPVLTNGSFFDNHAASHGGAIGNFNSSPVLTNVTFGSNSATSRGGAIYNVADSLGTSNPILTNAILWGNTASQGGAQIFNNCSCTPTINYSIVQGGDLGSNFGTAFSSGTGNLTADPLFVDALNGDLHLLKDSPGINVGDNNAVLAGITTDLDGNARIFGNTVDMGAYEYQDVAGTPPLSWQWEQQPPLLNEIRDVWRSPDGHLYAVGAGKYVLHYDGTAWTTLTPSSNDYWMGVWGSSSTDIFVVGYGGRIAHFNGVNWIVQTVTNKDLRAVWGTSATNVYAVGASGTILHYDGSGWSSQNSSTLSSFFDIWGYDADHIWAVGDYADVLFFDGSSWSRRTSGLFSGTLYGITGFDGSNIIAVGWGQFPTDYGTTSGGIILRYNGTNWTREESGTAEHLYSVWISESGLSAYAVGSSGTILHHDGSSWSGQVSGTGADLVTIWGNSASDLYVAGLDVTVLHSNGAKWSWSSISPGITRSPLTGIWGDSCADFYAVGGGVIPRWNGVGWQQPYWGLATGDGVPIGALQDIWVDSEEDIFLAGYGRAWRKVRDNLSATMLGDSTTTRSIWGSSATNVFAVGSKINHFDGTTWTQQTTDSPYSLFGVWGIAPNSVYAVGDQGAIIHYDGVTWRGLVSGTAARLLDVWGSGPNDIFAVGNGGTILHYDGTSWYAQTSGVTSNLNAVWGRNSQDVYAVGDSGIILHYDGVNWSSQVSDTTNHLYGVWGNQYVVFAVGDKGSILSKKSTAFFATGDNVQTNDDTPVTIDVLGNDCGIGGDLLAVVAVGSPSYGTVSTDRMTVTYTPTLGYAGSDVFTYTVSNGSLETESAVTVTVVPHPTPSTIYVDKNATGANNGVSWSDAYTNLQEALTDNIYGDEVWVAKGVYYPDEGGSQTNNDPTATFSIPSGVAVYGGFVGTETSLAQRDWTTNITVLSGDIDGNDITDANGVLTTTNNIVNSNARHVVTMDGTRTPITATTRLDGFTITGGKNPNDAGGGFICNGSGDGKECSPSVSNVTFSANSAGAGGGMYNYVQSNGVSSPILNNVTFIANSTSGGNGGAMYNYAGDGGVSSPILTNVIFVDNSTPSGGYYGGGMASQGSYGSTSSPVLTNVIFEGNSAGAGGGMYNSGGNGVSNPVLTNVTFSNNSATSGGGMYINGWDGTAIPVLTNAILWGNRASSGIGHQIYNQKTQPIINYSIVEGGDGNGTSEGTPFGDGTGNRSDDPLFIDSTNGNLRLQIGSPALDTGDNSAVPVGITTDLDGNTRVVNSAVDMGAYEYQYPVGTPTPTPTSTPVPPTNTPGAPTNTPLPPTNTPGSPTNTPIPSTNTPGSPTNTPIPPTNTPGGPTPTITPGGPTPTTTPGGPTPEPTATPGGPTNTPVPTPGGPTPTITPGGPTLEPTATPGGPTDTPVPPTDTPVPPTNTPVPPTNEPAPPTNTPAPPTSTPAPPTNTPTNTTVPPTATATSTSAPPTATPTKTAIPATATHTATATPTLAPSTPSASNQPPVAGNDSATTTENTPVDIEVLANDRDDDGNLLTLAGFTQAGNGIVTVIAGGRAGPGLRYTPRTGYNGPDSFTYTISDGKGGVASALVSVTVTPVNDAPIAQNDQAETDEDTAVAISVLVNDSDPDNDPLSITAVSQPGHGSAVLLGSSVISYTPDLDYNGSDDFTYTASDGKGGNAVANVAVIVRSVEDAPTGVEDGVILNTASRAIQAESVTIYPLSNDIHADGGALAIESVAAAANGSTQRNDDNSITYTRNPGFSGTDSFTYQFGAVGGNGQGIVNGRISVIVNPEANLVAAVDDSASTDEDKAVQIAVLGNDSATAGTLSVLGVTPQQGKVIVNGDGTVTYMPAANFHGTDSFTYIAGNGSNGAASAGVTVQVAAVNDPPLAVKDSAATAEEKATNIPVLANDSDVDGDTLQVAALTIPANGAASVNSDGTVTYTPAQDFNGVDSFAYTLSDGKGGSRMTTVSVTVTPENDTPQAADDLLVLDEDSQALLAVLLNDRDVDGDFLTITGVTQGALGSVTIEPGGALRYAPQANANGSDSFTYTVSDGAATSTATVGVTIRPLDEYAYLPGVFR